MMRTRIRVKITWKDALLFAVVYATVTLLAIAFIGCGTINERASNDGQTTDTGISNGNDVVSGDAGYIEPPSDAAMDSGMADVGAVEDGPTVGDDTRDAGPQQCAMTTLCHACPVERVPCARAGAPWVCCDGLGVVACDHKLCGTF
jgi:hypothetical protein